MNSPNDKMTEATVKAREQIVAAIMSMFIGEARSYTAKEIGTYIGMPAASVTRAINADNGFMPMGIDSTQVERVVESRDYPGFNSGRTRMVTAYSPTKKAMREVIKAAVDWANQNCGGACMNVVQRAANGKHV